MCKQLNPKPTRNILLFCSGSTDKIVRGYLENICGITLIFAYLDDFEYIFEKNN